MTKLISTTLADPFGPFALATTDLPLWLPSITKVRAPVQAGKLYRLTASGYIGQSITGDWTFRLNWGPSTLATTAAIPAAHWAVDSWRLDALISTGSVIGFGALPIPSVVRASGTVTASDGTVSLFLANFINVDLSQSTTIFASAHSSHAGDQISTSMVALELLNESDD